MIFSMASILNYHEKEIFMVRIYWTSGIMIASSILLNFIMSGYFVFFAAMAMMWLLILGQSVLYNSMGNYVWAESTINGMKMEELDIDEDPIIDL